MPQQEIHTADQEILDLAVVHRRENAVHVHDSSVADLSRFGKAASWYSLPRPSSSHLGTVE